MRILYLHARATNQFIKEHLSVSLYVVLSSTLISLSPLCCHDISLSLSLVRLGFCLTSLSLNVKAQSVSLCLSVSLTFSIHATASNQPRASTLRVCNDQKRSRLTDPMCTEVSSSSMAGLSMATLHALTQRLSNLKRTSKKVTASKQLSFLFFENKSSSLFFYKYFLLYIY